MCWLTWIIRLIIVILSRARSRSIKSIIAANCNFSHPCVLLSTIHAIAFASARPSVKILNFNSFNCEKYHILAFRMFDTDRETQFMHGNFKCGQHVVKLSCEERERVWEMETNYRGGSIRMECQHTAASPSTSAPEKLNCQIGGGRAGQEKIQIRSGRWFVRELAFHCSAKWKSIFIVTRDNDPLEKWREVFEHILTAWCLAFSHFTLSSRHTSTNQIWPHLHALMLRSG